MNRDFILSEIKKEYYEAERLKENESGFVRVYVHKTLNKKLIVRKKIGNFRAFEALKSLDNKNVERIYDVISDSNEDNQDFLVLEEYIEGETLSDILKRRLFNERQTKKIISQLCSALYGVHKLNVVHRDVKPENIMINRAGELKLIDFSAARLYFENKAADTEILGTIGYAAPEQFGLTQTDSRVDIYAAGVLMNILLTGEHPAVKIYPGKLKRIIEKCTRTVPEKRYKNALELKRSL